MEKQQNFNRNNNRNYNKGFNNNQPQKPRKMFITVPVFDKSFGARFRDGDVMIAPEEINAGLADLQSFDAFNKLTQSVVIDRATATGDANAKGTMTIGFITGYDAETSSLNITVFGGAVETVNGLGDNIAVKPTVIVDRDGNFKSFNQFYLVKV